MKRTIPSLIAGNIKHSVSLFTAFTFLTALLLAPLASLTFLDDRPSTQQLREWLWQLVGYPRK